MHPDVQLRVVQLIPGSGSGGLISTRSSWNPPIHFNRTSSTTLQSTPIATSISTTLSISPIPLPHLTWTHYPFPCPVTISRSPSTWSFLRIAVASILALSSFVAVPGPIVCWTYGGILLLTSRSTWSGSIRSKTRSNTCTPISRGSGHIRLSFRSGQPTAFLQVPAATKERIQDFTTKSKIGTLSSTWPDVNGEEIAGERCTISGS